MTRLQKPAAVYKGEVTAFLALIFMLMLSVVSALLQGATMQMKKTNMRAVTDLALESVFAEYHPELLEQYEIFARFGCSEEVIQSRMHYYGAIKAEHHVVTKELLTDSKGYPFYCQAVSYMKNWLGLEQIQGISLDVVEGESLQEEGANINKILEELLQKEEAELPEEDNPLSSTEKLEEAGILTLVVPESKEVSNCYMARSDLPSKRQLQTGNYPTDATETVTDKAFFIAYLSTHFSSVLEGNESRTLQYEQEYLIGGHASDRENLKEVCNRIILLRMVTNYLYLQTSQMRKAEAELLATTLCSLLTLPEITQVVKQALLLAWAYGESIVDMRLLLKKEKVPITKNDENWQLQLANLIDLGTANEVISEKPAEKGLDYQGYLNGLLLLESREHLSLRSLDLIESNLNMKTDQCMTKAVIESRGEIGLGVTKTFKTAFGYQ